MEAAQEMSGLDKMYMVLDAELQARITGGVKLKIYRKKDSTQEGIDAGFIREMVHLGGLESDSSEDVRDMLIERLKLLPTEHGDCVVDGSEINGEPGMSLWFSSDMIPPSDEEDENRVNIRGNIWEGEILGVPFVMIIAEDAVDVGKEEMRGRIWSAVLRELGGDKK